MPPGSAGAAAPDGNLQQAAAHLANNSQQSLRRARTIDEHHVGNHPPKLRQMARVAERTGPAKAPCRNVESTCKTRLSHCTVVATSQHSLAHSQPVQVIHACPFDQQGGSRAIGDSLPFTTTVGRKVWIFRVSHWRQISMLGQCSLGCWPL